MQLIAVLHNVRSIHNVGSVFRTADGAGFRKIYLCGITPLPLDRFGRVRRDFAKVSLGAEKYVGWECRKSTVMLIKNLKRKDWKIYALEQAKNSAPFYKLKIQKKEKIALVAGNEVKGLPKSILALADKIIEIPMYGGKESLNVGVAFGIAAYHLAEAEHSG